MKSNMNKFSKLLFASLILASSPQADAKDGYYVRGDLHDVLSGKLSNGDDYGKKRIKNSFGFGIGAGYDINRFGVDVTYTHLNQMKFSHVVDGSLRNQKFSSEILMLNGSYDFYHSKFFTSFINVGVGHGWNKAGNFSDQMANAFQKGATSSAFVWKVGAGVNYAFNEKVSVNLNYNYLHLNTFKTSQVLVPSVGESEVTPVIKTKLPLHVIGLGIKYKF